MSFRRFGGIDYSGHNNIVRSNVSNNNNLNIQNKSGMSNSKELFKSHIDLSGNSLLNLGCIYFQNGSVQCTATQVGPQGPTGEQGTAGDTGPWILSGVDIYYPSVGSSGTVRIDNSGNIKATSSTTWSDYRNKKNITPLEQTSYSIDPLKPLNYFNKLSGKQDIGFIAHEVQEYFPFLVTGEKDGTETQSVNYIGLIGLLTSELQQAKKEIHETKKEICEMKNQIDEIITNLKKN